MSSEAADRCVQEELDKALGVSEGALARFGGRAVLLPAHN